MSTMGGSPRGSAGTDWRRRWSGPRSDYSSETKPFFLTSEFLAFVLLLMGLGIATAADDDLEPEMFWILATVATSFYMLSRGIAKSGTRSRARDPREEIGRDD